MSQALKKTNLTVLAAAAALCAFAACTKQEPMPNTTLAPDQVTKTGSQEVKPVAGDTKGEQAGTAGTNDSRPSDAETQNSKGTEFPSIGASGKTKQTGSFPSVDKGAENPPPAQAQGATQPAVMPKDRNGEVGSPMASTIDSKSTAAPHADQLDVEKYPYSARHQFKTDVQTRLTGIDKSLISLEATKQKTVSQKSIEELKTKEQEASQKLARVETVNQEEWNSYKQTIRDDVLSIEKSYRQMSTTRP